MKLKNDYILIKGLFNEHLIIFDKANLKILEVNKLENTIEDKTKDILKYYNKLNTLGGTYFNIFVNGIYEYNMDLIIATDEQGEINNYIPFNLSSYYLIIKDTKLKKNQTLKYDKDLKNKFYIEESNEV